MPRPVAFTLVAIFLCCGLTDGREQADPGGGVAGLVTRHGFPVAARVELRPRPADDGLETPPAVLGPPLAVVSAGEDGSYRFDRLAPGWYELRAIAKDAVCFEVFELELPGERCSFRLSPMPTGEVVAERAVWADGTPFRGAVSSQTAVAATDQDGSFRLTTGSGRRIVAFQEGRIRRDLVVPEDGKVVVDAGLVPAVGTVLAALGGAPLPGTTVSATGYHREIGWTHTATLADAKGGFELPVAPDGPLTATTPGYLPQELGADGPFEFKLLRAPVVTGRAVSGIDRQPLPGVPVILVSLVRSNIESGDFMCPPSARATTDAKGRFRIESPAAGDVMVFVLGRGFVTPGLELATNSGFNPAAISLSPGEHRELEVAATFSPSISGRVMDPDGKGVPGVPVMAVMVSGDDATDLWHMGENVGIRRTVSGPDGRYRFATLIPGIAVEISSYPGDRPSPESVTVMPKDAAEIALDLVLPTAPPDRFVEVLVVAKSDGSPVPGAEVRLALELESEPGAIFREHGEVHGETTGPNGRARLGPFTRRPLLASAKHRAFAPRRDLPMGAGDEALRIELEPRSTPAEVARPPVPRDPVPPEPTDPKAPGVDLVIQTADGQPVASGVVFVHTLRQGYRGRASIRRGEDLRFTDGKTRFVFADREWLVWLDIRPDGDFAPVLIGPIGWEIGPHRIRVGPESPVAIEVGPPGDIDGKVVGPDGVGVRGARVFAIPVNRELLERGTNPEPHGAAYCDGAGKFRIEGLGDGEYLLRVAVPPTLLETHPVTGRASGGSVEIRLATAVAPTITVLDPEGKPLEDVRVRVHHPDDRRSMQSGRTDDAGTVRFAHLDPEERYALLLHPGYDRPEIETLEVADWKPGDGTFRLAAARVLRGIVLDRDGFPISRATVCYQVPGEEGRTGEWEETTARENGQFTILELPRRPIRLTAHPAWRSRRLPADAVVEVDADEDETEIKIDGGPMYMVRVQGWREDAEAKAYAGWSKGGEIEYGSWQLTPDGRLRLHCFEPGGKVVFWVGLPGGLMAYGELEPDVEHVLPLRPGKSIEGEIVVPEKARVEKLMVYGEHFVFEAPVGSDGRFKIWSLPDGEYQLFARAILGSTWFGDDAKVKAGDKVRIELKPEK